VDLTSRATLIGGIALVVFAVLVIVFVAGQASVADDNPFEKTEVADYLIKLDEHKEEVRVGFAFAIGSTRSLS
jgi:hypothetical protein